MKLKLIDIGCLGLALFLGAMILYYMDIPNFRAPEEFNATLAKELSTKNYDAAKHSKNQNDCLAEVTKKIKLMASNGWNSVVINQSEICAKEKQVSTIFHLIKELQMKGFTVERNVMELKISW